MILAVLLAGAVAVATPPKIYDLVDQPGCPRVSGAIVYDFVIHTSAFDKLLVVCPNREVKISRKATVDELRTALAYLAKTQVDNFEGPPDDSEWLARLRKDSAHLFPPKEYDHPAKNMIVTYQSPSEIQKTCGERTNACAFVPKGLFASYFKCFVILPLPHTYPEAFQKDLFKHEQAHCNGWNH